MKHKPKNYVLEVHFASGDVFSRDYGPEQGCVMRAAERMAVDAKNGASKFKALRIWHGGQCIARRDVFTWEGTDKETTIAEALRA